MHNLLSIFKFGTVFSLEALYIGSDTRVSNNYANFELMKLWQHWLKVSCDNIWHQYLPDLSCMEKINWTQIESIITSVYILEKKSNRILILIH